MRPFLVPTIPKELLRSSFAFACNDCLICKHITRQNHNCIIVVLASNARNLLMVILYYDAMAQGHP
jgi:hypothetical protein